MRDLTYSDVERLETIAEAEQALHMDEDAFRAFYDRTARSVWLYLAHATGDRQAADDLLQEVFYRFLRAGAGCTNDAHRRHYVFRVAANLVRDRYRRRRPEVSLDQARPDAGDGGAETLRQGEALAGARLAAHAGDRAAQRIDLDRALAQLSHRERDMLWLAYAEGASHAEIAGSVGVKTGSVKLLLFRARRRLAALLAGDHR
jgi:RNA polymerase sigma-70 factor (ECF subfamily)